MAVVLISTHTEDSCKHRCRDDFASIWKYWTFDIHGTCTPLSISMKHCLTDYARTTHIAPYLVYIASVASLGSCFQAFFLVDLFVNRPSRFSSDAISAKEMPFVGLSFIKLYLEVLKSSGPKVLPPRAEFTATLITWMSFLNGKKKKFHWLPTWDGSSRVKYSGVICVLDHRIATETLSTIKDRPKNLDNF